MFKMPRGHRQHLKIIQFSQLHQESYCYVRKQEHLASPWKQKLYHHSLHAGHLHICSLVLRHILDTEYNFCPGFCWDRLCTETLQCLLWLITLRVIIKLFTQICLLLLILLFCNICILKERYHKKSNLQQKSGLYSIIFFPTAVCQIFWEGREKIY